jgi:hypothetical protein
MNIHEGEGPEQARYMSQIASTVIEHDSFSGLIFALITKPISYNDIASNDNVMVYSISVMLPIVQKHRHYRVESIHSKHVHTPSNW